MHGAMRFTSRKQPDSLASAKTEKAFLDSRPHAAAGCLRRVGDRHVDAAQRIRIPSEAPNANLLQLREDTESDGQLRGSD